MVFWGSIKNESDVHVMGFSLCSAIEISFFERFMVKEGSSVVPLQAQGIFGGVFWTEGV